MEKGSIVFIAGNFPGTGDPRLAQADGDIIFKMADGLEFMRLCGDGQCLVRGSVVDKDRTVYENFREWLLHAVFVSASGEDPISYAPKAK